MGWFKKLLVGTEEQITGDVSRPRVKQRRDGRWMGRWNQDEVLDADTPGDAVRRLSELAAARRGSRSVRVGRNSRVEIIEAED